MEFNLRQLNESDVGTLRILAQSCPPLGLHSAFTYWVVAHFYSDYSLIATDAAGKPAGYVMCITKRDEPDLVYVWQVGVLEEHRKQKLALTLLQSLYDSRLKGGGIKRMQITIDENNRPSNALFRAFAAKNGFELKVIGEATLHDPIEEHTETENLVEISIK